MGCIYHLTDVTTLIHEANVETDMDNMAVMTAQSSAYRDKALKTLGELPPFSPVLNRLLADLGRDDVSFSKISDLIEKDTVIAGNILRVVNSALYGRRGTVNSVRSAVSVLGLNKLRNFVLGMSVARMWSQAALPKHFSTSRFNLHSVATALMADLLAQQLPIQYPEGAFVAGLFHDLGKLLIAVGMRSEWAEIDTLHSRGGLTWVKSEELVLGLTHAELSNAAVAAWALPEPIQSAVRHHHDPTRESVPEGLIPLSRAIAVANHHVNLNGRSVDAEVQDIDLQSIETMESLGLPAAKLASMVQQYEDELAAISNFFR